MNSIILLAVSIILYLPISFESDKHGGKCTGAANCRACKYCKHCNSGGSCGVCGGGFTSNSSAFSNSSSSHSRSSSGGFISYQSGFLVKAHNVNVRSGPGTNYEVIGGVSKGDIVNGSLNNSSWVKVEFVVSVNGNYYTRTGYVSKSLLKSL
jgi:hypothetical protein